MPFSSLATKVRKDPMGPLTLEQLRANVAYLRRMVNSEHIQSTGEHNAVEVSRVCRQIDTGTTVSPASTDIASVSHPATGKRVLTLASSRFTSDIRAQINVVPTDDKPHTGVVSIVSATSVEVYTQHLTSTLGVAGNVWAAVDAGFDIALHSQPLDAGSWNPLPQSRVRGDTLNDDYTASTSTWNALVQEEAELYRILTAGHTSAGVHNVRQTAFKSGLVRWDGATTYAADSTMNSDFTSFSRLSKGIVQVDFAAMTTPVSGFACHDYQRQAAGSPGHFFLYNVTPISSTRVWVLIFRWSSGDGYWIHDDSDFFLAVHGS